MNRYCLSAVGLSVSLLLLIGCSSSVSSRYYLLNPISTEGKIVSEDSCPTIGVGPVKLPDYVNRTQIVSRARGNELTLSYLDLWGEPLTESVPRMIGENLSRLLCTKEIVFFPWRPSRLTDIRVEVEVLAMDGTLGGNVSLDAWWSVASGKNRIVRKATYTQAAAGQGYDGLVQAHSLALGSLSRDIAAAITQIK